MVVGAATLNKFLTIPLYAVNNALRTAYTGEVENGRSARQADRPPPVSGARGLEDWQMQVLLKGEALRTRARVVEDTISVWFRGWSIIGTAALSLAMAVLLASCGAGEDAGAGDEAADGNSGNFEYGDYNDWDADSNDEISEVEFNEGVYTSWDADDSGTIEENEFDDGVNAYYKNYNDSEYGDYDEWDADNNDELSQDEFDESVVDTGLYGDWDADGNDQINEDEFNEQAA